MKAIDVTEAINSFMNEAIVPAILRVTRAGGGGYTVESTNDYSVEKKINRSFADFSGLEAWLKTMRAWDIPKDKLNMPDVNIEIPVDMVMLDYDGNYDKDMHGK